MTIPSCPIFVIATISNKLHQYEEMKASCIEAGFDEQFCEYRLFDNSNMNLHEPFSVINHLLNSAKCQYIILTHQDILLDKGFGARDLQARLSEINQIDSGWAVAGVVGVTQRFELIAAIDPATDSRFRIERWPVQVASLDEHFLVFNPNALTGCSPDLQGFHFYGTDVCLRAAAKGYRSYAIDFRLTHLSQDWPLLDINFFECLRAFQGVWGHRFVFKYAASPTTWFFLSRYGIIGRVFTQPSIMRVFRLLACIRRLVQGSNYYIPPIRTPTK